MHQILIVYLVGWAYFALGLFIMFLIEDMSLRDYFLAFMLTSLWFAIWMAVAVYHARALLILLFWPILAANPRCRKEITQ